MRHGWRGGHTSGSHTKEGPQLLGHLTREVTQLPFADTGASRVCSATIRRDTCLEAELNPSSGFGLKSRLIAQVAASDVSEKPI
jgi:hypothetical protein